MGQDGGVTTSQATSSAPTQGAAEPSARPTLYRSTSDRVLAGVCGGLGEHLGVSSTLVRAVMVILTVAGPGLFLYAFLWLLTKPDTVALQLDPDGTAPPPRRRRALSRNQTLLIIGAAVSVVGLGWAGPTGELGGHLGWLLPILVVAVGAFLAWSQLDDAGRGTWGHRSRRGRFVALARPALGVVLATVGAVWLATQGQGIDTVLTSALAAVAVLAGAVVIAAPWVVRMWQGLQAEQTERIRATERADIAAHLHDSVLQTLALIQRRADDPATVVRLARSQERELREWLYAGPEGSEDTLATAIAAAAHDVEDGHGVAIELVVSGDRPIDPAAAALVQAAREAMLNAVRHGEPPVSVYVEAGPAGVDAFVRDHGPGFELGEIGEDRHGVRESILRRMARHGGAAKIRRLEDGTEVELTLPPPESDSAATEPAPEPATAAEAGDPHTSRPETTSTETTSAETTTPETTTTGPSR